MITIGGAREQLLLDIARCPNVALGWDGIGPCATVVGVQDGIAEPDHQVPEPWSGGLSAPILFVSSNPSIDDTPGDEAEAYPTSSDDDALLCEFFEHRFDGAQPPVKDGKYGRLKNGDYARATPFWSAVRLRAAELLGREPVPGHDYALTEIVHCKSRSEAGVKQATRPCVDRYLERLLDLSEAKLLVVIGAPAQKEIRRHLALRGEDRYYSPTESCRFHVCFLPHPNAFGGSKSVSSEVIAAVRPVFGPSAEDLRVFAEFANAFESDDFVAGTPYGEEEVEPGVYTMGGWIPSEIVIQWETALYDHHIIDGNSDYLSPEFARRMNEFAEDLTLLSAADLQTVRTVLTNISRGERFCDGYLCDAFDRGVAQAATRRLVDLARQALTSDPREL